MGTHRHTDRQSDIQTKRLEYSYGSVNTFSLMQFDRQLYTEIEERYADRQDMQRRNME